MIEKMEMSSYSMSLSPMFDFSNEAPANWLAKLEQFKQEGIYSVRTQLYWGLHEQLRGIRDFSKSPCLRLEKFLSTAQNQGLCVEFDLGFLPLAEGFPAWTFELSEKAVMGRASADEGDLSFFLTEFPSLYGGIFFEAFLGFLEELSSIISLYRYPEGPVKSVEIDVGLYETDLNAIISRHFARELEKRYHNIESLNRVYQSSFKDFSTAASERGFRLLGGKRAWLASYDYKWCRKSLFSMILSKLEKHVEEKQLFEGTDVKILGSRFQEEVSSIEIAIDPVFLEAPKTNRSFPCFPCGSVSGPAANAFRIWEYLNYHSSREGIKLGLLPLWEKDGVEFDNPVSIICGPYLSRVALNVLRQFIKNGGFAFFPFGLPKYDEQMNCFNWALTVERDPLVFDFIKTEKYKIGKGALWVSSSPLPFSNEFWDELHTVSSKIKDLVQQK